MINTTSDFQLKERLKKTTTAKPILKWAGGKSQLLEIINEELPKELLSGQIKTFIEPFVGGGAVFFDLTTKYKFENIVICDYNKELFLLYKAVKNDPKSIFEILKELEKIYLKGDTEFRKKMYYEIREKFNDGLVKTDFRKYCDKSWSLRAAYIIFLNKTCFNGLFRVNKSGFFNVPQGDYKNPTIADQNKLMAAHYALSSTEIVNGDFQEIEKFVDKNSFVYFDPPYRPLSESSSFTSYSDNEFNDEEQIRLSNFFRKLDKKGAKLMLSNSDPQNLCPEDKFFEKLYNGFNIKKVLANRMINSKSLKRGALTELLITNY